MSSFLQLSCLLLVSLIFSAQPLQADDGLDELTRFIAELDTFEADFEQSLYGSGPEPLETSVGSVRLKRPGRFVWTYTEPETQIIIADGERIWMYDKDLEQVTVNPIDDRIVGSPLELLMNAGDLAESFDLRSLGDAEGIRWVELSPREPSSDFEMIFIGLDDSGLAAMELRDNFGQATQIRFSNFKSGIALDDSLFVFDAPDGVDILGLDEQ
ncbi:MAG: outer membrane lipoprotein chaperone LolA [Granulosicoccus sp.]